MIDAVIFDLDGVLLDSETRWNEAKQQLTEQAGGQWSPDAPVDMMGMSSHEWTRYMRDQLQVPLDLDTINRRVVALMEQGYEDALPFLPGAQATVRALKAQWPIGLASSSNREIIDIVVERGFADLFDVTVSSEEVDKGKPAPDVYLEAARKLAVDPARCVAIEDSSNGLRAASAAGIRVIAVPNEHYPPSADALALAAETVHGVAHITPDFLRRAVS